MPDGLFLLTRITGLTFVTMSMASAGLAVTPARLGAEARRIRPAVLAILANFVVAPLLAWVLTLVIPMRPGHSAGLLLLGAAAGAPFLPKLAEVAGGNLAFALWMMLLLLLGTSIVVPLVLPILLPGARLSAAGVLKQLIIVVLLPLAAGLSVRRLWQSIARAAEPAARALSNASLAAFFLLVVSTHVGELWGVVGSGAIFAAVLFTLATGAAAYGMAGGDRARRSVLVLGTAQRNVAVALVVADAGFADQPDVRVMVLVVTLVSVPIVFWAASALRPGTTLATQSPSAPEPLSDRPCPRRREPGWSSSPRGQ